jgi:hypothetical protein
MTHGDGTLQLQTWYILQDTFGKVDIVFKSRERSIPVERSLDKRSRTIILVGQITQQLIVLPDSTSLPANPTGKLPASGDRQNCLQLPGDSRPWGT